MTQYDGPTECPKCNGPMLLRSARADPSRQFLGCAKFPGCDGTRNLPAVIDEPTQADIISVSDLNERAKGFIEGRFSSVWVSGEISEARTSRGHLYATLKDQRAQLDLVMWETDLARVRFKVEPGLKVLAHGHLSIYTQRGSYQLVADQLRPEGQGALELAFKQLHAKLTAEGLFDPARKQRLPAYPIARWDRDSLRWRGAGRHSHDPRLAAPHISSWCWRLSRFKGPRPLRRSHTPFKCFRSTARSMS